MSERAVQVHVDLKGSPTLVGTLHPRSTRGREGATFAYAAEWLEHPQRFALEPALSLGAAPHHTIVGRALFGAVGDSAPDRWGRTLINRAELRRARAEKRAPRALREIDYLLGVSDETRLGALRFKAAVDGPFLADRGGDPVPPLVALARLVEASARVEGEDETIADLRLLLAPGSSLGGARPKASVGDRTGQLLIAKFPSERDQYDVVRWEAVTLELAAKAGIDVPGWRLREVAGRTVLLVQRFDRRGGERVPFLSALSLMGADDHETYSYPEIADALRRHGAAVARDLPQLWRRMIFNVLAANLDDHLRNHAVLYDGPRGWRLSPAYDLNPVPADLKPRLLTTTITRDHDPTASRELAFEVARDFALTATRAKAIALEVGRATATWRAAATRLGFKKSAIERMASAFEPG